MILYIIVRAPGNMGMNGDAEIINICQTKEEAENIVCALDKKQFFESEELQEEAKLDPSYQVEENMTYDELQKMVYELDMDEFKESYYTICPYDLIIPN